MGCPSQLEETWPPKTIEVKKKFFEILIKVLREVSNVNVNAWYLLPTPEI